jgi:signal peptidase I
MNADIFRVEKKKSVLREYAEIIIIALALALPVRAFVFQAFKIPSGSMLDTLLIGDHVLVNKFVYGPRIPFTHTYILQNEDPRVGDIVVFEFPDDPSMDYIKRIVGCPGDILEMRNKVLYRNGQIVDEPYVRHTSTRDVRRDNFSPITVPAGHYFLMGDNRDESSDSRFWKTQFVERGAIHGKAWRLYWSWADLTDIRWGRIGRVVE